MESESIVDRVKFAILPYLNPDIGDREATKAARAAISALREPTEEMRIASGDALYLPLERARELAEEEKFNEFANDGVKAYTAMIDAALK